MKKSLFAKAFISYLIIIITLSSLILFFSFRAIKESYIDSLTQDLSHLCITLETKVTSLVAEKRYQELDSFVKDLGKHIQTRITVIDPSGIVLADSEKNPAEMEKHNLRVEIMQALQGKVGTTLRFSTTVKEEMLYVAMPIELKGTQLGVVRVSLFIKDINRLFDKLWKTILYGVMVILIIAMCIALMFSRSLTRPIRALIAASRRVAAGDFATTVLVQSDDEFKELGDSFNYMTDRMSSLFSEVSGKKEELHSIISSIQEGLLVLDRKGNIILSNESMNKILTSAASEGKPYWEVIREPQFSDLINRVVNEKKSHTEEISLHGKTFSCSATVLAAHEEIVIIFHDITESKKLEKIKKDFVVNVSHELRTPLTAIKGFVETLEEDIDDKNRNYLSIISRNTDRLIHIVEDLLVLSQLEEKGAALQVDEIDVAKIIEHIHRIFEPKLKEKGLVLTVECKNETPRIKGDAFKLEQVFVNVIDNAVKYTERGSIRILLEHRDHQLAIEIEDTGIGIPREHLARIFERFYVVDASRSRQLGGTGLGLSIVKHIVLLHNGTIDVESTPGKGTKFIITLPC
jgi:two-component system phosphate regulon sensor histidine kinase PhoR